MGFELGLLEIKYIKMQKNLMSSDSFIKSESFMIPFDSKQSLILQRSQKKRQMTRKLIIIPLVIES
jgi:hypothetical protein